MYSVILVDDEEWSLKLSMKLFQWENFGFSVKFTTTSQQKALEYLAVSPVDVILLDMRMPGMSGEEMLKEIRSLNKTAKIVILSGFSVFEYAKSAIDYGVFAYYLKPLTEEKAEELIIRLKDSLDENNMATNISSRPKINIENKKFHQLIKYIEVHHKEKLYLNELSEKFGLNLTYCCHLFKKHFNMGFNEFVTELKMKSAAELITTTDMSIEMIAEQLNYEYVYFGKLFKKKFGVSPRQYRIDSLNERQQ